MLSQKEAIYLAFCDSVSSLEVVTSINDLTPEQLEAVRNSVKESVAAGLKDGTVQHDNPTLMSDHKEALKYAGSLFSNWTKRDQRISGIKYTPNTVRGPQTKDEILGKLMTARKAVVAHSPDNTDLLATIDAKINLRKTEINAAKPKKPAKNKVTPINEALESLKALGIEV